MPDFGVQSKERRILIKMVMAKQYFFEEFFRIAQNKPEIKYDSRTDLYVSPEGYKQLMEWQNENR